MISFLNSNNFSLVLPLRYQLYTEKVVKQEVQHEDQHASTQGKITIDGAVQAKEEIKEAIEGRIRSIESIKFQEIKALTINPKPQKSLIQAIKTISEKIGILHRQRALVKAHVLGSR